VPLSDYTVVMRTLVQTTGTLGLLAMLGGCFQAQLNGPVSGARITVSDLRNHSVIYAGVDASSAESMRTGFGDERWQGFGPVRRLWLLGIFQLDLSTLADDSLYLVTATGGEDSDNDRDREEDLSYTPVLGSWHAIMSGAQLKSVGPKVSALTEASWQWLSGDLDELSDSQVAANLDRAAASMISDVDKDGSVDVSDLLLWSRLFDSDGLIANQATLNNIAQSVVADGDPENRRALSQQLVGLDVVSAIVLDGITAEHLAEHLAGLSLADFFVDSYRALLLRTPEDVVAQGLIERYGLETVGLNNVSDSYAHQTYDLAEVILAALHTFNRNALSAEDQLSYDVYQYQLEDMLEGEQYLVYRYPASSWRFDVPRNTEFFFSDLQPLVTEQDALDYIARLRQVDEKFTQLRAVVAARTDAGIIEPSITLPWSISNLERVAGLLGISSPYYGRFDEALDKISELTSAQREDLRVQAVAVLDDEIRPAYNALVADLRGLEGRASEAIGFGQFEGGEDFYGYALRHRTTTDMTAAQIHQLGLDELQRIHTEIRALAEGLGYTPSLSLQGLFDVVANDGGVVNDAAIVSTYEDILALAQQNLPQAFDVLPQQELVVIGDASGGGFYVGASDDGSRPGAFYAGNVGSEAYYRMPSLAYHEGVPGHHLQNALGQEQDLPDFRRYGFYNAFSEGWALYAERLAYELGWYQQDPYGDLGRLQYEALRATRLVVDTGIHDLGWSWDEAVDFFRDNAATSQRTAEGAVARYMRWPAQATSYMVGMKKFLELRERMQQSPNYDIRQFHNLVLTEAALPLSILEQLVDRAIAAEE
jgi:uncharacterized protein (DUF885 family)